MYSESLDLQFPVKSAFTQLLTKIFSLRNMKFSSKSNNTNDISIHYIGYIGSLLESLDPC